MRKLRKTTCILLLAMGLGFASWSHAQTTMSIQLTNGSTATYSLSSTSKVYFQSSALIVSPDNSSTLISSIRKIIFSNVSAVNEVSSQGVELSLYPSPAQSYITISCGSTTISKAMIYSSTGILVRSVNSADTSETIDISSLPKGMYIVKVNNQTAKFIKL